MSETNTTQFACPAEKPLFPRIREFVRKSARRPYKIIRATLSNHLADYTVERNGETVWIENPAKRVIHGVYDVVSEPMRTGHWAVPRMGNDKTAYVLGLYGSGRWYIHGLMRGNFGQRAKYIRQRIRFHERPTSMIYTGHATIKYASRGQRLPSVTQRVFDSVRSGFADLIFVYRHPLDSLLTNWVWWRTYLSEKRIIGSIWDVYKSVDDLCVGLEQDFPGFRAFAEGDPRFFSSTPGPRFLSLPEFVEETDLYVQSAALATRLEDFTDNPRKEFLRIAEVLSVPVNLETLKVPAPRAKPYGYRTIEEKVPRFREFVKELDLQTKQRMERIGYGLK